MVKPWFPNSSSRFVTEIAIRQVQSNRLTTPCAKRRVQSEYEVLPAQTECNQPPRHDLVFCDMMWGKTFFPFVFLGHLLTCITFASLCQSCHHPPGFVIPNKKRRARKIGRDADADTNRGQILWRLGPLHLLFKRP